MKNLDSIPGPKIKNFIGKSIALIKFFKDPIKFSKSLVLKYGDIIYLTDIKKPVILAFNPKYTELFSNSEYFSQNPSYIIRKPNSPITTLASNLLNMEGDKHFEQRKMILPYLSRKNVKSYTEDMVNITNNIIDNWEYNSKQDIYKEMKILTLLISSKTLFNIELKRDALDLSNDFQNSLKSAGNPLAMIFQKNIPFTPYNKLFNESQNLVNKIDAIIQSKKGFLENKNDVLSMLMKAIDKGCGMSHEELIGQMYLMFQASHDTTSNTLTWTLFLLAQHPKIMAKLVNEINFNFVYSNLDFKKIEQFKYLENVINESMRIIPTSAFGARKCKKDFNFEGYSLPEGSLVVLSPYMVQNSSFVFENPKKFIPERWDKINPSNYEYFPFGLGKHSCLGYKFAMIEMKIILILILKKFQLSIIPMTKIDRCLKITLFPKNGLPMLVSKPDGNYFSSEVKGNINEMVDFYN